ncbi:hypothetical protein TH63_04235 [Rufibacter radiotolerans]|uniref:Uncharacterized protein n=1 Tax=Rufibacter radiotolerans TaxID=1379910 RepID=A0A0H4VI21_9BACT|nr:hypothetical protein TH63_04235 [Rufibacter radiotolerans]
MLFDKEFAFALEGRLVYGFMGIFVSIVSPSAHGRGAPPSALALYPLAWPRRACRIRGTGSSARRSDERLESEREENAF